MRIYLSNVVHGAVSVFVQREFLRHLVENHVQFELVGQEDETIVAEEPPLNRYVVEKRRQSIKTFLDPFASDFIN